MKIRISVLVLVAFSFLSTMAGLQAQGTFQNLNFEAGIVPPPTFPPSLVPVAYALPGWVVYYGANQQSEIFNDAVAVGSVSVSLTGASNQFAVIQGAHSVILQCGSGTLGETSATISQTALVPADAQSITMLTRLNAGNFRVSLNGQDIPLVLLGTSQTFNLASFGGDISSFAGQNAELRISVDPLSSNPFNNLVLDNIQFSMTAVPEPGALAMLSIGLLVFARMFFGESIRPAYFKKWLSER